MISYAKITTVAAAVLAVLFLTGAYRKPGPLPQQTPIQVIDGTSLGAAPSFTYRTATRLNVGGFSTTTVYVKHTFGACSKVCMSCYAGLDGTTDRYTVQALDTSAGVSSGEFELSSGTAKICKPSITASSNWVWTVGSNYQYIDCDFSDGGGDATTDDLIDATVIVNAP
jgi:hypothetical protein